MKILFDNKIDSATLSMGSASTYYPVTNLQHRYLRKRVQSTLAADTIVAILDAAYSIDSVWYGFTNATAMEIRLYSVGPVLEKTISIATPEPEQADAVHFTSEPGIVRIEIDLTAAAGAYLGGFGAGVAVELSDPLAQWSEPHTDNSFTTESPGGQGGQNYVPPLRGYAWSFAKMTRAEADVLAALFDGIGIGRPLYVDPFHLNHVFMKPIYARVTNSMSIDKPDRTYELSLSIKEAR